MTSSYYNCIVYLDLYTVHGYNYICNYHGYLKQKLETFLKQWQVDMTAILFKGISHEISCDVIEILAAIGWSQFDPRWQSETVTMYKFDLIQMYK